MTLTKAHLIEKTYKTHDLSRDQAREVVEAFLEIVINCLTNGENLLLSGFGKFYIRKKSARRGRNPQTGEDMMLDARRVVTFKPSGKLRDRVNG